MNRLSDSLSSSLTGGAASLLGTAAVPSSEAAGPPGASADGAGFAQVLGRMQEVRAGDGQAAASTGSLPTGIGQSGAVGAAAGEAGVGQAAIGPLGELLATRTGSPGSVVEGRQELAAAFVMQWAALAGARASPSAVVAAGGAQVIMPGAGLADGLGANDGAEGPVADQEANPQAATGAGTTLITDDPAVGDARVVPGQLLSPERDLWMGPGWGVEWGSSMAGLSSPSVETDSSEGDVGAAGLSGGAPTLPPVVAWQLSPHLSVITAADGVASSDEALRAYAAGQGFDPVALQRMFGGDPTSAMRGPAAGSVGLPGLGSPGAGSPGAGTVAALGSASAAQNGLSHLTTLSTVSVNAAAPGSAGSVSATTAGMASALGATTAPASLAASAGAAAAWWAQADPSGRTSASGTASAPSSLAASLAMAAQAVDGAGGEGASGGPAQAASLQLAGGAEPGLRQGMTSAWAALQARASGSLMAGPLGPTGLGADATAPLVVAEAALAGSGSGSIAGATTATAAVSPSPVWASADTGSAASRTEVTRPVDAQPLDLRAHLDHDREVLARRVGEALAARVLAQVERGEWQIRLSVTPEQLGPIDIDLRVQGSRMEAQFQVANGQTQSLIQDGLGRLREAVGASGMDLASVWVSGGWNERNRGNPTPGQPDGPAPGTLIQGAGDEQAVEGVAAVEERRSTWTPRQGALDILI